MFFSMIDVGSAAGGLVLILMGIYFLWGMKKAQKEIETDFGWLRRMVEKTPQHEGSVTEARKRYEGSVSERRGLLDSGLLWIAVGGYMTIKAFFP